MDTNPQEITPTPKRGRGQPSKYSERKAAEIIRLMTDGKSIRSICRLPRMPDVTTIYEWQRKHPEFSQLYAQAQIDRAAVMGEDVLDISDNGTNDYRIAKNGETVVNMENINRSRLRVDSRKWLMARMDPKRWGERTVVAGDPENPMMHLVATAATHAVQLTPAITAAIEQLAIARLEATDPEVEYTEDDEGAKSWCSR